MNFRPSLLPLIALACTIIGFAQPELVDSGSTYYRSLVFPVFLVPVVALLVTGVIALTVRWGAVRALVASALLLLAGIILPRTGEAYGLNVGPAYWWFVFAVWLLAWVVVERLVADDAHPTLRVASRSMVPVLFGLTILFLWEAITRGAHVPQVILPPPSMIWARITASVPTLLADFQQTFLKAVLICYALGCGFGFSVYILIDC